MKEKLEYQGCLVIPDFLMLLPLKDEVKQKYGVTEQGFAIIMSQLLRRAETIKSNTVTITSDFLSKWTHYRVWTINKYLNAMRELKFISWESKNDRKPRVITINYGLLNKMSRKYDETIGVDSEAVVEETAVQEPESVNEKPAVEVDADVDIVNRIVSFFVSVGTTNDFKYVDRIRDEFCGGDEEKRRVCTRRAKEEIRRQNLL